MGEGQEGRRRKLGLKKHGQKAGTRDPSNANLS